MESRHPCTPLFTQFTCKPLRRLEHWWASLPNTRGLRGDALWAPKPHLSLLVEALLPRSEAVGLFQAIRLRAWGTGHSSLSGDGATARPTHDAKRLHPPRTQRSPPPTASSPPYTHPSPCPDHPATPHHPHAAQPTPHNRESINAAALSESVNRDERDRGSFVAARLSAPSL
jgi:hypothetical protein